MAKQTAKSAALEAEIREAFAPAQAAVLLKLFAVAPAETLSMGEAAKSVGLTREVFRRIPEFRLANVAPAGHHPRFDRKRLERIAANLLRSRS